MLDIVLFRVDQGGDPEIVRESQRRRYADVTLVDQVIEIDTEWRKTRGDLDDAKKALNKTQKDIGQFMKKKETPPEELLAAKKASEAEIKTLEEKEKSLGEARDAKMGEIGNLVPDSVPVHDDEDYNTVEDTYGAFETEDWMMSHYDLTQLAGIANTVRGSEVAGSRGYFLTGPGMLLNQALISYATHFLTKRGHTMLQTPFVMNKSLMSKVAQLADFDEQLYKVTGSGEDQYLIATSEQPICAFHHGEWLDAKQLPIKYAGYSTCFRKEAGSHGRDQLGIFRVHQFEKIEQFCITSPEGDESWEMQAKMMDNCKEFYKSLGIPYRVVNIVSGALNDAAAKKFDLEAWFPGSKAHRELVSCSNCTDFQSRRLEVRYGQVKQGDGKKKYVHMLNSTLIATERAMCCVLENYQTPTGIKVPEVLQEYMGGMTFIPFVAAPAKPKKGPAPVQHVPTEEELKAMDEGKAELQAYMDTITPTLNDALNKVAKERPADPLAALATLLAAGKPAAADDGGGASGADGDVVYKDVLAAFVNAGISEMSATKPDDPYRKMYEFLFQASLVDYTTSPAAADKSKWDIDFVAKFGLVFHGDTVIASKAKGQGPKSGVKFMLADAGDFFSELSKKMKATGAPLTGMMTAEELRAADAAAMKLKREKEAKEQAARDEADAANAVRAAEMEASGKKVTGGLHKFDASEVDIYGGEGTADDLMDAFGF